jgi:hypothetical protein
LQDDNGNDSLDIVPASAVFSVTKEIIQLNKIENKNPAFISEDNPDKVYIKSPAGVFTELTIPIKEIVKGIGKRKFSGVTLSLNAYPKGEWEYGLDFPGMPQETSANSGLNPKLLLIEPDSIQNFFEMKKVADFKTSFTTQFKESTYSYDYRNIANVVQNAIDNAPDKDLKLWLIPIETAWYSDGYGNKIDYLSSYDLFPSAVTLRKGGNNLKIRVTASDLTINK